MKTVLILVLSCEAHPYKHMMDTAFNTWDSIHVEGCESLFYCGKSNSLNTDKMVYLPVKDSLETMGEKTIQALEYALKFRQFDYIARVHSSCYVDKKELIEHIQTLPDTGVFSGVEASSQNGFQFLWGGGHYIISKDVVKAIVDNRDKWNHRYMEDESMSLLVTSLGIPFHAGKSCSINITNNGYLCLGYGGGSLEYHQWSLLKPLKHFFFRVKQDQKRHLDEEIMIKLFENL